MVSPFSRLCWCPHQQEPIYKMLFIIPVSILVVKIVGEDTNNGNTKNELKKFVAGYPQGFLKKNCTEKENPFQETINKWE